MPWLRYFPDGRPEWDGWRFLFDPATPEPYDYLVAYDDLAGPIVPRCPPENTVHVATEPLSVRGYDPDFAAQFGLCLTLDPRFRHPRAVLMQPGLCWFAGWVPGTGPGASWIPFRDMEQVFDEPRTRLISVMSSNKRSTREHRWRYQFAARLKRHFGDRIDFFGRGFAPIDDKLDALRGYRFHVALENSSLDHYFTEKLTDAVIAGCYPIYYGCPNLDSYLPADSFSRIELRNFDAAVAVIEGAIAGSLDIVRRDGLREARRRLMHEHNLFAMLGRVLTEERRGRFGAAVPPRRYGDTLLPLKDRRFAGKWRILTDKHGRPVKELWLDRLTDVGRVWRS